MEAYPGGKNIYILIFIISYFYFYSNMFWMFLIKKYLVVEMGKQGLYLTA